MTRVHPVLLCACIAMLAKVAAQPASAPSESEMPMADYLGLLQQIAPAAESGARAYLSAFEQRCGRAMRTAELRRAMSQGDGDPVLMGLIRANHVGDTAAQAQLVRQVQCARRTAP